MDARDTGEFAVWEYGGYITTTDDIPDNCDTLNNDVIKVMVGKAAKRKLQMDSLKSKKNGMKF